MFAGGGARGAYEAGVMAELLPELERRDQRPDVIVGTSVGAINAAYLASVAHLSAGEAVAGLVERWEDLSPGRVIRPIVGLQTTLAGLRYLGDVLALPGVELRSFLDASPLAGTLDEWLDWQRLHRNVSEGLLDAAAVVATSALSAHSIVFVEGRERGRLSRSHEIEYVPARLTRDQVRASAAIPTLFEAIRVEEPREAAGWYFDGGTRLNTPIKPAIDLGVDRVIVIGTHSVSPVSRSNWHEEGSPPDFGDGAVQLLFAALVDSLIEDVRMLGKINLVVGEHGPPAASRRYKERRGKRPYRRMPYMFIAPRSRDTVGDVAARVFHEHYGGLRGLRSPDIAAAGRLLGGISEPHAELLSYLLFSAEFARELIELGRSDARAWLERDWGPDGPWLTDPVEALEEQATSEHRPGSA